LYPDANPFLKTKFLNFDLFDLVQIINHLKYIDSHFVIVSCMKSPTNTKDFKFDTCQPFNDIKPEDKKAFITLESGNSLLYKIALSREFSDIAKL
jgi:hypothetical protein